MQKSVVLHDAAEFHGHCYVLCWEVVLCCYLIDLGQLSHSLVDCWLPSVVGSHANLNAC